LSVGQHTVTVTDANGCMSLGTVEIGVAPPILVEAVQLQGAICNSSNGSAQVNITGGNLPYTIVWSDGQFGNTASGLAPGVHSVEVNDANGCMVSTQVFIENTEGLSELEITTDPISCFGMSDGALTANPLNGSEPYSYEWSGGLLGQTITGVGAGMYTVTVTDAFGCQVIQEVELMDPDEVVVIINGNEISCETVGNGSATLEVSGGTEPYEFLWSNGETTSSVENLNAGLHTVEVTDANGCGSIENVFINQDDSELAYLIEFYEISCWNGSDGGANIEILNGLEPFTFNWPNGETDSDITGLSAGTYSVFVEDLNGCSANVEFTLEDPEQLIGLIPELTNTSCSGEANGTATVQATGGTPPYSYLWPDGTTDVVGTGLGPGLTIVQIFDDNGCTTNATVLISTPESVTAEVTITKESLCAIASGEATVEVDGGVPPYTYLWTSGGTGPTEVEIPVGFHEVEITDANGCLIIGAFFMNGDSGIEVDFNLLSDPDCTNPDIGSASINVTGGLPPYEILWSNGETTELVEGLSSGEYDVLVTDAEGCAFNVAFDIPAPEGLVIEPILFSQESCAGSNDGEVTLIVEGGVAPYSFEWSNGIADSIGTNLAPGLYDIFVEDSNGCTGNYELIVETIGSLIIETDTLINTCINTSQGVISVSMANGVPPFIYDWSDGSTEEDRGNLPTGLYNLTVTDANGCEGNETFIVFADPCDVDLELDKQVNAQSVALGDTITYLIVLHNAGPGNASNIEVFDQIPSELGLVAINSTNGNYSVINSKWVIPSLATGESDTLSIEVTVDALTGPITNFAEVIAANQADSDSTPDNGDPTQIVEDDEDLVTVLPEGSITEVFDLALLKSLTVPNTGIANPGDNVVFTMTIFNQGAQDAFDIMLVDYFPNGLTLNDNNWTEQANVAILDQPFNLPAGGIHTIDISFVVDPDVNGILENFAEIGSANTIVGVSGSDIDSQPNFTNEDLVVDDEFFDDGTIDEDDHDVALIEIVDEVLASDDTGADQDGSATSSNDSDADTNTSTSTGTGDDDTGDLGDDGTGTTSGLPDGTDSTTTDSGTVEDETFDLALRKTISHQSHSPLLLGQSTVTYQIEVCNQGAIDAFNITVTDYLPETGLSLVDANWTVISPGQAQFNYPIFIAAGNCHTLNITFVVDADASGVIANYAEIFSATNAVGEIQNDIDSTPDTNNDDVLIDDEINDDGTNDEDDHDVAYLDIENSDVVGNTTDGIDGEIYDLALTKTLGLVSQNPVVPGSTVSFEIEVFNQGDAVVSDIEIVDYLPGEELILNDTNWTSTGSGIVSYNFPFFLAPGNSAKIFISFLVEGDALGQYDNFAEVFGMSDNTGSPVADIDSNPDNINNDVYINDVVDDNGTIDEDDHDIASIFIDADGLVTEEGNDTDGGDSDTDGGTDSDSDSDTDGGDEGIFDLALIKTLETQSDDPIIPGQSTVTFVMQVCNQGTIDAYNVTLTDYLPEDYL